MQTSLFRYRGIDHDVLKLQMQAEWRWMICRIPVMSSAAMLTSTLWLPGWWGVWSGSSTKSPQNNGFPVPVPAASPLVPWRKAERRGSERAREERGSHSTDLTIRSEELRVRSLLAFRDGYERQWVRERGESWVKGVAETLLRQKRRQVIVMCELTHTCDLPVRQILIGN